MGRPRKKAADLTTEEVVKKLFPAKVVREAKKTAESKGKSATKKDSSG
jgi:hypothetical protein